MTGVGRLWESLELWKLRSCKADRYSDRQTERQTDRQMESERERELVCDREREDEEKDNDE